MVRVKAKTSPWLNSVKKAGRQPGKEQATMVSMYVDVQLLCHVESQVCLKIH